MRVLITLCMVLSFNANAHGTHSHSHNFDFDPTDIYAGGGDIVGNGGGIAETNFVHAYSRLSKLIDNCLNSNFCVRSEKEFNDLSRIKKVTDGNIHNISKLVFTVPEKYPSLFFTHDADVVRLAVTGLKATDPIFVNLDMLYETRANKKYPALSYGEIVNILVHEFGHNAGYKNHAYLDYLGSLVRGFMEQKYEKFTYELFSEVFNVNLINFSDEEKISEFWISFGEESFNVTDNVYLNTKCDNGDKPFSIQFMNYHQEKIKKKGSQKILPLNVWAKLICIDGPIIQNKIVDVYLYLKTDKKSGQSIVDFKIKKL